MNGEVTAKAGARGTVLAVDIGGTLAKLALVTAEGKFAATATVPAPTVAEDYVGLNGEMRRLAEGAELVGVGLSIAGLYDDSRRVLTYHPNNPRLEGADFVAPLLAGFEGLPWAVERDINAGALGEYHFGVGRGSRRFLCVVVGTGVGAGMIVDGELLRFAYDGIGDPGYVICKPGGAVCPGGSVGCLEAEVSSPAIAARALGLPDAGRLSAGDREELASGSARAVIAAAREGEAWARELIGETGRLLGIGLSTLASIFAPDTIAIAGGVAEAGEFYAEAAREAFFGCTAPFYAEGVRVEKAALGGWANLAGAGAAVGWEG